MEFKKVTKNIYNESDYYCLEEDMSYICLELLQEKIPTIKKDDFELRYDLSYSQGSGVNFTKFDISFNELIKYMFNKQMIGKEEYDILYSAHDEGLFDFDYDILSRNKIQATTSVYKIAKAYSTTFTYDLLFKQYGDHYIDEEDEMSFNALDDILSSDDIELAIKELLDTVSNKLQDYGYNYIEAEDEYECKNILFDNFMKLNNIETNIEYFEGGEYLRTKQQVLDNLGTLEYSTLVNDNNLNDYYIANNILNEIEEKEKTVQYYLLTI